MGLRSQIALASPFSKITAITANDSTDLSDFRALYVLTSGNLALRLGKDAAPTTLPVTAGQILNVSAKRVMATNTTATVVGLN